jgi:twitching motility protein PilI
MSVSPIQSPFRYLQSLASKGAALAGHLPVQIEQKEAWKGVLFELRGHRLLAPMTEVAEILTPPPCTRIPGVKSWAYGMSNMRGNLLPVMDLQGFLYGENLPRDSRRNRLLVVSHGGVYAGLVVESVLGMKHFWMDDRDMELPIRDPVVTPYLQGSFRVGEEHLAVFSPWRLARDEAFLNVAS